MYRLTISRTILAITAPVLAASLLAMASAPKRITVSGVSSLTYSQQHASAVTDAGGPMLLLNEARGSNRNTGKPDYMAGADVTLREIADLTQGNGAHQGYITMARGSDTTVSSWRGKVVTTLGPDQKPVTRFEGTWTSLRGTGKYEGATGSGAYKGRLVSPTELTVEWRGDMELGSSASR